jgi:choline kinase
MREAALVEYAVILAVGSSNHQSQIAYNRPRAMLPVLGKPLVLRVIELFYRAGIRRYIIVVGEDEGSVASYLHARLPDTQVEFMIQSSSTSLTRTLATIARRLMQPFIIASYNSFVHPRFPERLLNYPCDWQKSLILGGTPLTLSTAPSHYIGITEDQRVTQIVAENQTVKSRQPCSPIWQFAEMASYSTLPRF